MLGALTQYATPICISSDKDSKGDITNLMCEWDSDWYMSMPTIYQQEL